METLRLKRRNIDVDEYIKRTALESDYETLIEEPCVLVDADDGKVKIIYDHLGSLDTSNIVSALKDIRYDQGQRARGLVSRSRIFGYRPRLEMRADFCSSTSMAVEHKTEHALVSEFALKLEEYYKTYNPEGYALHRQLSEEKVKTAYRIQGKSVFTSGIINKNNPLKYHFDTGNFTDVYSCMVVFKGGGISGGYLSVPEYGVGFKLPNNSIFLFDGQSILHGVTPIKFESAQSYRYSIVYYSLKRMWQCLEIDQELARIRKKKTERERTRMAVPLTEEERKLKEEKVASLIARKGKQ
jgi:hypothetical protein